MYILISLQFESLDGNFAPASDVASSIQRRAVKTAALIERANGMNIV